MAEMSMDELIRARDYLDGKCPADEQTFSAIGVLSERLEHLKEKNPLFAAVNFSPDLQRLSSRAVYSVAG